MTEAAPDPVAAYLAEVRELVSKRNGLPPTASTEIDVHDFRLASRVPRLVAALDRVLALAAEWDERAEDIDDGTGMTQTSLRAGTLRGNAGRLRAAIRAALLGEESTGG